MFHKLRLLIPEFILPHTRKLYASNIWFPLDLIETHFLKKNPLTPPLKYRLRTMPFSTASTYEQIGRDVFQYIKKYCQLKPTDSVLDVGCGSGRIAVPFTQYLNKKGKYAGFDIIPEFITWNSQHITPLHPNFHFTHANLYNKLYNPRGSIKTHTFQFPYQNNTFDVVFLTSIFTHLLPRDISHYLSQIHRVLKKGAHCFISYFLLNNSTLKQLKTDKNTLLKFPYHFKNYRTAQLKYKETAVAYEEKYLKKLYKEIGFKITKPILYGQWSKKSDTNLFQDVIIATK